MTHQARRCLLISRFRSHLPVQLARNAGRSRDIREVYLHHKPICKEIAAQSYVLLTILNQVAASFSCTLWFSSVISSHFACLRNSHNISYRYIESRITVPHTKCAGNKKFAMPSLTAYSCPQFPHTSFPLTICVSNNSVCNFFKSSSSISSIPSGLPSSPLSPWPSVSIAAALPIVAGSLGAGKPTSSHTLASACHSRRGMMLRRNRGLKSSSVCSSSASRMWRGKAAGRGLQVLMAQVRKLRVSSFIVVVAGWWGGWYSSEGETVVTRAMCYMLVFLDLQSVVTVSALVSTGTRVRVCSDRQRGVLECRNSGKKKEDNIM